MGFNHTLKNFFFIDFLFLLFFLNSFLAFPSSSHEIKPQTSSKEPTQYQVFYVKNTSPFFLDKEELNGNNHKRKRKMVKKRKKMNKNFKTRPFSVMLPKGFVPPSGSSPCHNAKPNSKLTFYCDLSTAKP